MHNRNIPLTAKVTTRQHDTHTTHYACPTHTPHTQNHDPAHTRAPTWQTALFSIAGLWSPCRHETLTRTCSRRHPNKADSAAAHVVPAQRGHTAATGTCVRVRSVWWGVCVCLCGLVGRRRPRFVAVCVCGGGRLLLRVCCADASARRTRLCVLCSQYAAVLCDKEREKERQSRHNRVHFCVRR